MKQTHGVLIVDDDEDDLFLTQRAVEQFVAASIVHVESGRAAIDYLAGEGEFADRARYPKPEVVFLDLKMNDLSGHDVLQWVREKMGADAPRIFVLTGSNEPRDRQRVKDSGAAAGYIVKPLLPEHVQAIFRPPA
jgi:CheY-like chemotaxis protein